jgi:hypothetical protein
MARQGLYARPLYLTHLNAQNYNQPISGFFIKRNSAPRGQQEAPFCIRAILTVNCGIFAASAVAEDIWPQRLSTLLVISKLSIAAEPLRWLRRKTIRPGLQRCAMFIGV